MRSYRHSNGSNYSNRPKDHSYNTQHIYHEHTYNDVPLWKIVVGVIVAVATFGIVGLGVFGASYGYWEYNEKVALEQVRQNTRLAIERSKEEQYRQKVRAQEVYRQRARIQAYNAEQKKKKTWITYTEDGLKCWHHVQGGKSCWKVDKE
ncbi:MAG: hypothetical protein ACU837_10650 [Gammaproteobacteria bacterium]